MPKFLFLHIAAGIALAGVATKFIAWIVSFF
jgi:hypothetical protein